MIDNGYNAAMRIPLRAEVHREQKRPLLLKQSMYCCPSEDQSM